MQTPLWIMRLFRLKRPIMETPETPFLVYWPGEIVRHMGRPKGDGFLAGCVVDAGRKYVAIKWEDADGQELITDPAQLAQIIKQPMPAYSQL
jgi:hypothetical protein